MTIFFKKDPFFISINDRIFTFGQFENRIKHVGLCWVWWNVQKIETEGMHSTGTMAFLGLRIQREKENLATS